MSQTVMATVADVSWQIEAVADFNADARPDLVWRSRTTGQNVVWYMDGPTFVSQALLPSLADTWWHIGSAADFDGDGRVDVVWRSAATGRIWTG